MDVVGLRVSDPRTGQIMTGHAIIGDRRSEDFSFYFVIESLLF